MHLKERLGSTLWDQMDDDIISLRVLHRAMPWFITHIMRHFALLFLWSIEVAFILFSLIKIDRVPQILPRGSLLFLLRLLSQCEACQNLCFTSCVLLLPLGHKEITPIALVEDGRLLDAWSRVESLLTCLLRWHRRGVHVLL